MNFKEALNRKAEDIQRPPNLPVGHYILVNSKHPEVDEFTDREGNISDRVHFTLRVIAPTEDVDEKEIEAYGNVSNAALRHTIWIMREEYDAARSARGWFQLRNFIERTLGVDISKMDVAEMLSASVNTECIGEVIHVPAKDDPETVYDNLGKLAPVD